MEHLQYKIRIYNYELMSMRPKPNFNIHGILLSLKPIAQSKNKQTYFYLSYDKPMIPHWHVVF